MDFENIKKAISDLFTLQENPEQVAQPQKPQNVESTSSLHKKIHSSKRAKNGQNSKTGPKGTLQTQRKPSPQSNGVIEYIKSMIIEEQVECSICMHKRRISQMIKLYSCEHEYCCHCLKLYVQDQLNSFITPKCPEQNCQCVEMNKETLFYKSLPNRQKNLIEKIRKFHFTSNDPYLKMCPTESCDGLIPMIDNVPFQCPLCHNQFCKKCMYSKHDGKCAKHQITFLNAKYRYRKCGKCGIIVQKTQACNHITCKCGYEFCYGCGRRWPGNSHHCAPRRVMQQSNNQNTNQNAEQQSIIIKILKFLMQVLGTIFILSAVSLYAGICLFPMILMTLVFGVLVGMFVYSFKCIYDNCKKNEKYIAALLILVFPIAMVCGVYEAFKSFWCEGFLFWWQILREAIERPLALIWS